MPETLPMPQGHPKQQHMQPTKPPTSAAPVLTHSLTCLLIYRTKRLTSQPLEPPTTQIPPSKPRNRPGPMHATHPTDEEAAASPGTKAAKLPRENGRTILANTARNTSTGTSILITPQQNVFGMRRCVAGDRSGFARRWRYHTNPGTNLMTTTIPNDKVGVRMMVGLL